MRPLDIDNNIHKDFNDPVKSLEGSVGRATGYGLGSRVIGVRVPVGARVFSSPIVRTGSGAYPASYPMGFGGSFTRGKAVGV
jgi:hypothetical protein